MILEKPRNGTTLTGCFAKTSFKKKVLLKTKEEERKMFSKNFGDCTGQTSSDNMCDHITLIWVRGLFRSSLKLGRGAITLEGYRRGSPDTGLCSQMSEAIEHSFTLDRGYSSAPSDTVGSSAMAPELNSRTRVVSGCRECITCR